MDITDTDKHNIDIDYLERSGEPSRPGRSPARNTEQPPKRRVWGYWLVIVLLLGAVVGLVVLYGEAVGDVEYYRNRIADAEREYGLKVEELRGQNAQLDKARETAELELQKLQNTVGNAFPLVIEEFHVDNVTNGLDVITPHNKAIYASDVQYAGPWIKYTGLKSGTKKLKIKIYDNLTGKLQQGSNSPAGCTYFKEKNVEEGPGQTMRLGGWGNSTVGSWSKGTYRCELWYETRCLGWCIFSFE